MSPLLKTLSLSIVAIAASFVAAYFYPWADIATKASTVGEPLFKDYEPTTVRRIIIERFDPKTRKLTTVVARRKGDQWLLPDKDNFVVSNARHIAQVTNALLQREVLEETSSREADHSNFGVIDPALHKTTANKSALGIKITLEDGAKRPIANLIVGKPAGRRSGGQTQKRFVSIPGQPNVYMLEINPLALTTRFEAWIQPNLFQLSQQVESELFFEKMAEDTPDRADYKLVFNASSSATSANKLPLSMLQMTKQDGTVVDASLADSSQNAVVLMVRQLAALFVTNVFASNSEVKGAISDAKNSATASDFESLKPRGIKFVSDDQSQLMLAGAKGKVGVEFGSGLVITMYLGDSLTDIDATADRPERYGVLVATVDEALIEIPVAPEVDGQPNTDEAEKEEKAYLLAVKERNETLKSSRVSANEFNQQHAGWIYAVPEEAINNLLPVLELEAKVVEAAEPEKSP